MRKFLFATAVIAVFACFGGCKFQEEGYTVLREWDAGTFMTKRGVVKYLSAKPDTATSIHDIYAKVETEVNYARMEDSIVQYGHCWSKTPDVRLRDTMFTLFYPESYESIQNGLKIQSTLTSLEDETNYYIRSYVVTGKRQGDEIIAKDTAYNPVELPMLTEEPRDLWEERSEFSLGQQELGAISFTYNGKMYMGLGHTTGFVFDPTIYEFDPATNTWTEFTTLPSEASDLTNSVCFVIENVKVREGVYSDFLYVGTGLTSGSQVTDEFWRLDIKKKVFEPDGIDDWAIMKDNSKFIGGPRQNAVGFSVNGKGYVGLGTASNGGKLETFYELVPEYVEVNGLQYPKGKWTKIKDFSGGARTQSVSFVALGTAYISCGVDKNGNYRNDLYAMSLSDDGVYSWLKKRDFPGTARIEAVGMNIDVMGFIGTGRDATGLCGDFYRYNPYVNAWDERKVFLGIPRQEAVGCGLKDSKNIHRGYLGLGIADDPEEYLLNFFEYRP